MEIRDGVAFLSKMEQQTSGLPNEIEVTEKCWDHLDACITTQKELQHEYLAGNEDGTLTWAEYASLLPKLGRLSVQKQLLTEVTLAYYADHFDDNFPPIQ